MRSWTDIPEIQQGLERYAALKRQGETHVLIDFEKIDSDAFGSSPLALGLLSALECIRAYPQDPQKDLPRFLLSIVGLLDQFCGVAPNRAFEWTDDLCRSIWRQISSEHQYQWTIMPAALRELRRVLPEAEAAFSTLAQPAHNKAMRGVVGPHLSSNSLRSRQLAMWIVRHWGGIKRLKDEKLNSWLDRLGDFSEAKVFAFADQMRGENISSWSKLLAFYDCERHAIYDARTSVALNCILVDLRLRPLFFMPIGQNRSISDARLKLRQRQPHDQLYYSAYRDLLRRIVELGLARSIMEAEMAIFANSTIIAGRFNAA